MAIPPGYLQDVSYLRSAELQSAKSWPVMVSWTNLY
jgi:hypothetical protein